jgi:hypothetical protein
MRVSRPQHDLLIQDLRGAGSVLCVEVRSLDHRKMKPVYHTGVARVNGHASVTSIQTSDLEADYCVGARDLAL